MVGRVMARGGILRCGAGWCRVWRRDRARAELEVRDDRWGPPMSRAWRGAKAVRLEASPREGGGKWAGHHHRVASWANWAAEAQWGGKKMAG
jgi:hypothetical protein